MGCTGSKLDDLPAVALCRERCAFLDEAIKKRYNLAGAHLAYIHSLRELGVSLHRFFDQDLVNSTAGPPSPVLNLPPKRKGDPEPSGSVAAAPAPAIHHSHSHSHSGSHLHFNSDSEDDDSASESLHLHSDNTTPVHPYSNYGGYADQETLGSYQGGGFVNMNYMRNKATPSVVYQQKPTSPETVHMAESSSYNPYPYGNQNPNPSNYSYPGSAYPNYGSNSNYGGFFGSSPPPPYGYSAPQQPQLSAASMASSSKPPPPPPSPPRGSTWDFLNPFETFERYYPPYTPSRDSKEVREEEGIPDLEDEDYQQEIVKEVHGRQKFVDGGGAGGGGGGGGGGDSNYLKAVADDEGGKASVSEQTYHTRPSVSMEEEDAVEFEVHVVDKKVVDKEDRSGDRQAAGGGGFRNDSEVVKEIQVQFERASDSGNDLAKMLEVGKIPYTKKHGGYLVSSKMLPMVASQPSTSIENTDLDANDDIGLRSGGLSSTLQKLHLWEKKLYEEVKVEEKMRILHERKLRKLKHLDEKGAEAHKVDATRSLVRSLSTKIRISIQVVDKISVKINKVRDEDLWPQLNEFIQGLARMWRSMLECHHSQSQAVGQARRLDAIASHKHMSEAHRQATKHLALELLKWISRFSDWVIYQKGFVKALNNWLLKCLLYEPEETPDGIVPFSPGRIGAPPVFIICNQWSQALDQISEREVIETMRDFASNVLQLWERDKLETQQGIRDSERRVKSVDREEVNIQKEIQALEKRMVVVDNGLVLTGHAVYQSDTSKSTSLQVSLQRFFEAMERFTASSLKVCEELLQRIEEDKLDQEEPSESETV